MKDTSYLKTATGKEYPCDFMGVAQGLVLYVKLKIDLYEVLDVFQNPEETQVLRWYGTNDNMVREETGFTGFGGFTLMEGYCPVRIRLDRKGE